MPDRGLTEDKYRAPFDMKLGPDPVATVSGGQSERLPTGLFRNATERMHRPGPEALRSEADESTGIHIHIKAAFEYGVDAPAVFLQETLRGATDKRHLDATMVQPLARLPRRLL